LVPLVLLPFAVLVFLTTTTCIFDMAHWDAPLQERLTLMGLYAPYSALRKFFSSFSFVVSLGRKGAESGFEIECD
jgi:hypothetical protein